MYENLTFGELKTATRLVDDNAEAISEASVEHEDTRTTDKLILHNIGEGVSADVFVDLVNGELKAVKKSTTSRAFRYEDSNIDVSDGEMAITIERSATTISLVVECEGETNDDSGPDLDRFGVDI